MMCMCTIGAAHQEGFKSFDQSCALYNALVHACKPRHIVSAKLYTALCSMLCVVYVFSVRVTFLTF
jgi:hypothetical protein